jgi:SAM-dependent methyltransferase
MKVKENYFSERNKLLKSNVETSTFDPNRAILANREIQTFKTLCNLSGINHNLDRLNGHFLDVGAGDQFMAHAVNQTALKYIPLDINNVNFETDNFPVNDSSIDVIFSLALIEHIANIDHLLSECARVLKPDGVIFLSTPNFKYSYAKFYDDPTHVRPFTPKSLEQLASFFFKNPRVFPNARCKSENFYQMKYAFQISRFLPFLGSTKYVPSFLKGRSTGIFCLASGDSVGSK